MNDLFYKRAESNAYRIKVRGSRHASFGDPGLWGRLLHNLRAQGPPYKVERMNEIVNHYSLAFCEQALEAVCRPRLLDGPSPDYPEAVFKSHR